MNGSSWHWSHLEEGILVNQVKPTPRSFAAKQINEIVKNNNDPTQLEINSNNPIVM